MKTQTLSLVILILFIGAVLSFAKNDPAGQLSRFMKKIQTDVNTSQNINLTAKSIESCAQKGGEWYPESKVCEVNSLVGTQCTELGGEFNECASACRHNPEAQMCTKQCVLTCTFK